MMMKTRLDQGELVIVFLIPPLLLILLILSNFFPAYFSFARLKPHHAGLLRLLP
jgi:hypothetical protein